MRDIMLVGLGGALGSMARYAFGIALASASIAFPFSTLLVNVLGCFLMGALVGLGTHFISLAEPLRLLLAVGVLGGFTTFSTFSLETMQLLQRGQLQVAMAYIAVSVLLSLVAIFAGVALTKLLI